MNYRKFFTTLTPSDTVIRLPDKFIVGNSVTLYSDSAAVAPENYSVDYRYGKIKFTRAFFSEIISSENKNKARIIIRYKSFPFEIQDIYSRFQILNKLDTLKSDTVKVAEVKSDFIEDIFAGSDLQKSGSIFRGFTIGNNRDLSLNSGFRLQMTGKLSKDIDITAALTDENTPIQPEGNTQTLQEVDKVFIELRSSNVTTTLGDIDVNFAGLDFFNFSKKLQGAKGFASFGKSDFFVSGAIEKGTFNTNSFNGTDGIQGPYKLFGKENEVNIVIIAGSEKVYLDGVKMDRGESNDYTIDYSDGQVTFTTRRVITNASRIVIDFQYSDKQFSRSFIAAQTRTSLFKERLNLSFAYVREKDDENKPIDFTLSDSDKAIISQAGNDRLKASKSGVVYVGRDSTGKSLGQYIQVDTMINSQDFKFYKYQPGDTNALYQVAFSFVGNGLGDYNSLSTSVYQFVGIGQGTYLPIVFFPLPVSYQAGDVDMNLKISKSLTLNVEGAASDFNRNLLSGLDKGSDAGGAVNSSLTFSNPQVILGKLNLGNVLFSVKDRYINKQFNPVNRLNPVEYNRIWDIQDSTNQTENSTIGELRIQPKKYLSFYGSGGHLKRGTAFNSTRGSVDFTFSGDSISVPAFSYAGEYISSNDNSLNYKSLWLRQNGMAGYKFTPMKDINGKAKIGNYALLFQVYGEDKNIQSSSGDSASSTSFRFYEFKPQIAVTDFFHLDLSYKFNYRFDDIFDSGALARESVSLTHTYALRIKDLNFLSSNIDFILYDKKYTPQFREKGYTDLRTILVSSLTNLWFFNRALQTNLFYKVSSERSAKQQVIFIKVPIGQGNYKYLGDLNGNGIQDENEFVLVNFDGDYIKIIRPTDQLYPTTDLQSSVNININPSRVFDIKTQGAAKDILENVSFDTYLTVSEKSKDPVQKNIYLIRLSTFQNDSNTIAGLNSVQQDLNLFENNQYFGLRLRFLQRKGFNQFYSGNERLLDAERSVRLRLSFTQDLSLITDYVSETDRNLAPQVETRNWDIDSKDIISDLTYKPIPQIEGGFKIELKRADDNFIAPDFPTPNGVTANINSQSLRFSYALETKGKLRAEISRSEVILSNSDIFTPFNLTKGLASGKTYILNIGFDYRISNFIQATVNYLGRAEGGSKIIHTGTAEVRAYF